MNGSLMAQIWYSLQYHKGDALSALFTCNAGKLLFLRTPMLLREESVTVGYAFPQAEELPMRRSGAVRRKTTKLVELKSLSTGFKTFNAGGSISTRRKKQCFDRSVRQAIFLSPPFLVPMSLQEHATRMSDRHASCNRAAPPASTTFCDSADCPSEVKPRGGTTTSVAVDGQRGMRMTYSGAVA